ncbi:hypothetical protein L3Q82_001478 [Scortum barcoo]|uniref:Uncharacterized protein n=1 Tax=Scortum barcoo TaxID=214431 RepID=A0ACB8W8B5_9TELE|nr:hypothetical protein L3Q82_001478 [Scortum barcoo]
MALLELILIFMLQFEVSPSQPDGDPKRGDEVTLQCSLSKYSDPSLQMFSIRWLDETGTVLLKKDVESESFGQTEFVSVLTLKRQSGNNRTYTCQLVDQKNNVKTEADYTTVFTGGIIDDQPEKSNLDSTVWSPLSCVMLTLLIAGVILLIVITGIIIRWYTKRLADHNNRLPSLRVKHRQYVSFDASSFTGISGNPTYLYKRVGEDVILPCASESSSVTTCSTVKWLYNRESLYTFTEAEGVNVRRSSPRADRLNLDSDCSLIISKITAEDFGLYTCRQGTEVSQDVKIHLSVLTISPSQPDGDPKRGDEVTLQCSLSKYSDPSLQKFSIRWLNETGTVLLGKDFGYESLHSVLTVKRQSGNNRRYTCQLVDQKNNVKTEADYTTVFTDCVLDWTSFIVGAVVGVVVVVVVVIAAIIIKYRKRAKVTDEVQKPTQHHDESESNLTYVTVNHGNQKASPWKKVKEEGEVTYSTVKTSAKTDADSAPSNIYSSVSKPK